MLVLMEEESVNQLTCTFSSYHSHPINNKKTLVPSWILDSISIPVDPCVLFTRLRDYKSHENEVLHMS